MLEGGEGLHTNTINLPPKMGSTNTTFIPYTFLVATFGLRGTAPEDSNMILSTDILDVFELKIYLHTFPLSER